MSPRTLISDENTRDANFITEVELNQFFGEVVITGTETETFVTQTFSQYFPGQGLIVGGNGVAVATGTGQIVIGAADVPIVGDPFISVLSGSSYVSLHADAIVGAGAVSVISGTNTVTISGSPVGHYVHTQLLSSNTWSVSHNLSTATPVVQVYENDQSLEPDSIQISDLNNLTINFATGRTGKAVVLAGGSTSSGIPEVIFPPLVGQGGITVISGTDRISIASPPINAIVAGSNITVVSGSNTTTISSTASGGGSINALVGAGSVTVTSGTNVITISGAVPGHYVHTQASPSTTWVINHNLATAAPTVQAYESSTTYIIPDTITITSVNTVTLTFADARSGIAIVLAGGATTSVSVSGIPSVFFDPLPVLGGNLNANNRNITNVGKIDAVSGTYSASLTISGLPVLTSLSNQIGALNGIFFNTVTGSITLVEYAPYSFRVDDMTGITLQGTVSGTLKINGVDIQGISNTIWNTTQSTKTAVSSNTVSVGQRLILASSGTSSWQRFAFTCKTTRL